MIDKVKLAGLGATLAVALGGLGVTWFEGSPAAAAPAAAVQAAAQPAQAAHAAAEKPAVDCTTQAWPYVARECLAAANGTPVRKVARTITASGR